VLRVAHHAAGEEGGISIPLHHGQSIPQHIPLPTERFLCVDFGKVSVSRHRQQPGDQINQLAASTFSLATQLFDKHSGRSDLHALAVILLERDIRQGFGLNYRAQPENLVRQLAIGASALGGQFRLRHIRYAAPRTASTV